MKMLKLVIITLMLFLSGCSSVSDETLLKAHTAVDNGALIIDVRTQEEFRTGHLREAINIPLQMLPRNVKSLDKKREIVVYCRSGSRSISAAKFLKEQGYTVYDVGTQGNWNKKIVPKQ
jgi:phage shock protein E